MSGSRQDRRGRAARDAGRWARAEPADRPTPAARGPKDVPDEALQPRDRGPVRAHVRDLVDSRRGLVGLFAPGFGGTLIAGLGPRSDLQRWLLIISVVLLVVSVVDAVLLGRKATRSARARFPGATVDGPRTGWYAFMRAHRMRSVRLPPPRVAPGDPLP